MSEEVPALHPGEIERLVLLAEECGKVVQAVGKVVRCGYEGRYDDPPETNREALQHELGGLHAAIELMVYAMDIDPAALTAAQNDKWQKLRGRTRHQGGIL